jgi:methionyl-tRNA synthetase
VVYVWVDALINYWSALAFAREGEDLRPRYWPEVRHFLAKDILKFHCVIWPALLLAAGLEVPKQLFVHGYLLMDDRKMSKSVGNVIDPLSLIDVYGADPVRFYLFRVATFGQDGSISIEGLHERYERELGNDLGNLLSRTTAMIARYREGRLSEAAGSADLAADIDRVGAEVAARLDVFDITGALEVVWELVRGLNRRVEQSAPWELAKDDARAGDLDRVLFELVDGLRAVAIALAAFMPETSRRILAALGQPGEASWDLLEAGRTVASDGIAPAPPLFPRVDPPTAAAA